MEIVPYPDLNNIISLGLYFCGAGLTISNAPPNPMNETARSLLVEKTYALGVKQTLSWYYTGSSYYRTFDGDVWHDWVPNATATPPQEYNLPLVAGVNIIENYPALFWKNQFCEVTVVVSATKAAPLSDVEVIATLPEGFRPSNAMIFPCIAPATRNSGFLYVNSSGEIRVSFGEQSERYAIACFSFVADP